MKQFKRTSTNFVDFIKLLEKSGIQYIICLDSEKNVVSIFEKDIRECFRYGEYDIESGSYKRDNQLWELFSNEKYYRFLIADSKKLVKKYLSKRRILKDWVILNIVNQI